MSEGKKNPILPVPPTSNYHWQVTLSLKNGLTIIMGQMLTSSAVVWSPAQIASLHRWALGSAEAVSTSECLSNVQM